MVFEDRKYQKWPKFSSLAEFLLLLWRGARPKSSLLLARAFGGKFILACSSPLGFCSEVYMMRKKAHLLNNFRLETYVRRHGNFLHSMLLFKIADIVYRTAYRDFLCVWLCPPFELYIPVTNEDDDGVCVRVCVCADARVCSACYLRSATIACDVYLCVACVYGMRVREMYIGF